MLSRFNCWSAATGHRSSGSRSGWQRNRLQIVLARSDWETDQPRKHGTIFLIMQRLIQAVKQYVHFNACRHYDQEKRSDNLKKCTMLLYFTYHST